MSQNECTIDERINQHLNFEERKIIERMSKDGATKGEISILLRRDPSTIKREIKRGSVIQRKTNSYQSKKVDKPEYIEFKTYYSDVGQRKYEENRQNCGAKNKILACRELVEFVEKEVLSDKKWSPDAAIGYAKRNGLFESMVTTRTFYNWIDDGLTKIKNINLQLKVRRKPKSKRKEHKKTLGKSIDERPKEIEKREEFGHWEGDGIVGKDHKGHLITLVERKIGIGLLFNVGDRKEDKIVEVINDLEKEFGTHFKSIFKTITFDNGPEFSTSTEMEKGGRTSVYYAHPYSSWERGTNENWNGIVRRFIPKGSSFEYLQKEDIERIRCYINTLPRKRFGYKTPMDLWRDEISAIMTA